MNEGSGTTTADASGNGRTGTLYNNPTWITGKFGNALYFDINFEKYISTASFSIPDTGALTFEFWGNVVTSPYFHTFISDGNPGTSGFIRIYCNPSVQNLYFSYANGTAPTGVIVTFSNFFLPDDINKWVHVAIVADYTNRTIKAYKNGVLFGTYNAPHPMLFPNTNKPKYIGILKPTDPNLFAGTLDEVAIYNRVKSSYEIWADANA